MPKPLPCLSKCANRNALFAQPLTKR